MQILELALQKSKEDSYEGKDQDASSSSSSIRICNDPSSDEYVPDSDIISDSEDEYIKSANISSSRRFLYF
ncbi:hypothetical protein J6590_071960 [Homalodisca vitripennis]|nr:hypothetical protein J6590_071960 [Homalodisca vitripennis]